MKEKTSSSCQSTNTFTLHMRLRVKALFPLSLRPSKKYLTSVQTIVIRSYCKTLLSCFRCSLPNSNTFLGCDDMPCFARSPLDFLESRQLHNHGRSSQAKSDRSFKARQPHRTKHSRPDVEPLPVPIGSTANTGASTPAITAINIGCTCSQLGSYTGAD